MSFFKKVTNSIKSAAKAVVNAGSYVADLAKKAAIATKDAIVWGAEQAVKGAKIIADATVEAAKWGLEMAANAAKAIFDAAKAVFKAAVHVGTVVLCATKKAAVKLTSKVVVNVATGVGGWATKKDNELRIRVLHALYEMNSDQVYPDAVLDGDKTNKDFCEGQSKDNPSSSGIMPNGCIKSPGQLPKTTYVNGILNDVKGHCQALQAIADASCQEVFGVFNASHGPATDLVNAVNSIQRRESAPQITLSNAILDDIRAGVSPISVIAHSEGGLIAQTALRKAKQNLLEDELDIISPGRAPTQGEYELATQQVEAKLSNVEVDFAGTAVKGWPVGPVYRGHINKSDPVPHAIAAAQKNNGGVTFDDSAEIELTSDFDEPHLNPAESHSMEETYVPKIAPHKPSYCCKL